MRSPVFSLTSILVVATSMVVIANSSPLAKKDGSTKDSHAKNTLENNHEHKPLEDDKYHHIWTPYIQSDILHDQTANDLGFLMDMFNAEGNPGFNDDTDTLTHSGKHVNINADVVNPAYSEAKADDDFSKLRRRASFSKIKRIAFE